MIYFNNKKTTNKSVIIIILTNNNKKTESTQRMQTSTKVCALSGYSHFMPIPYALKLRHADV